MSVPRLIDLAAEEVVKCIVEGKFNNVDYILPARPSNKIFGIIKKYKHIRFKKLREQVADVQIRMLRPSKMDLYCPQEYMKQWDLDMTKKQNLVAIKLGLVKSLGEYHKKLKKTKFFDIVAFLEDILNPVSRRNLLELDIHVHNTLPVNWTVKIASMLPSLNVLNMAGNSCHQFDLTSSEFSNLCSSFPNLTELDISCSNLPSLKGISKLKNLCVLSVGCLKLNDSSDIEELFELKRIEELRMSKEKLYKNEISNILKFFIQSNRHLPRLKVLDCSETRITDEGLDNIIQRHSTLKKIVAFGTEIKQSEIPGIELLTTSDITSTVKSLAHFRQERNDDIVKSLVFKLSRLIFDEPSDTQSPEGLGMAIREINCVSRRYKYHEIIMFGVSACCRHLTAPIKLCFYGAAEKFILVDMILGLFEHNVDINDYHLHYLDAINKLHTPQPGSFTNRACGVALNAFLKFNEKPLGLDCLEFLEQSIDHVDSSPGFILATDKKKKLLTVLRKMHRSRDLEQKYKRMAGKVERFVQKS